MSSFRSVCLSGVAATVMLVGSVATESAHAQSSKRTASPTKSSSMSRSQPVTRSQPMAGSQKRTAQPAVAMQGYCAVCVMEMKQWVQGSPAHQVNYDGKVYYFPGEEQKQKFLANPAKYAPALGGDCAVCSVDMGKQMPGKVQFPVLYENRLFLFPGEKQKAAFNRDPAKYANADLVLNGQCAVCRVEMNQNVPGKPEFSTIHEGMRYLFPGEDQRRMFLANPGKYSVSK